MMKYLYCLVPALLVAGCNTFSGVPSIKSASIVPEDLKPGDSAVITVEVLDKHQNISRIEGVVKEDSRITFKLMDDGQDPDTKAGDGVWSLRVDVPFQAPPGEFALELTAYRSDGIPVQIRQKGGGVVPLQETLPVIIRYAEQ